MGEAMNILTAAPDVSTLGTVLVLIFLFVAAAVVALSWIGSNR